MDAEAVLLRDADEVPSDAAGRPHNEFNLLASWAATLDQGGQRAGHDTGFPKTRSAAKQAPTAESRRNARTPGRQDAETVSAFRRRTGGYCWATSHSAVCGPVASDPTKLPHNRPSPLTSRSNDDA